MLWIHLPQPSRFDYNRCKCSLREARQIRPSFNLFQRSKTWPQENPTQAQEALLTGMTGSRAPPKVKTVILLICMGFILLTFKPRISTEGIMALISLFPVVYEDWKRQAAREVPLSKNRRVLRTISLAALWVGIVAAALFIKHFFHVGNLQP